MINLPKDLQEYLESQLKRKERGEKSGREVKESILKTIEILTDAQNTELSEKELDYLDRYFDGYSLEDSLETLESLSKANGFENLYNFISKYK